MEYFLGKIYLELGNGVSDVLYRLVKATTEEEAEAKLSAYAIKRVEEMRIDSKQLKNITLKAAIIETTL